MSCFNASHWGDFMLSRIILECLSRQFKQTNDKNHKMGESLISKLLMEGGGVSF